MSKGPFPAPNGRLRAGSGLRIVIVIAGLAAVGAGIFWFIQTRPKEPQPDKAFQLAVATLNSKETLTALDEDAFDVLRDQLKILETVTEYKPHAQLLRGVLQMRTASRTPRESAARNVRFQEAIVSLDFATENEETAAWAFTLGGVVLLELNRAPFAERSWLRALEADEDFLAAHRQLAVYYYDNGQLDKAQEHLKRVGELAEGDPRPYRLLAVINKDYDRNQDALANYKEAFRRDANLPDREGALIEMAEVQIKMRQYDSALITLGEAKPSAASLALEGECFYAQQKIREAKEKARAALEADKTHYRALLLRGSIALESRDLIIARQALETAVQLHPAQERAQFKLAQVYSQLKKPDLAKTQLQKYRDLQKRREQFQTLNRAAFTQPNNADIRYQLGQLAFELQGPEMAQMWYMAAIRINQNHTAAQQELARIRAILRNRQR